VVAERPAPARARGLGRREALGQHELVAPVAVQVTRLDSGDRHGLVRYAEVTEVVLRASAEGWAEHDQVTIVYEHALEHRVTCHVRGHRVVGRAEPLVTHQSIGERLFWCAHDCDQRGALTPADDRFDGCGLVGVVHRERAAQTDPRGRRPRDGRPRNAALERPATLARGLDGFGACDRAAAERDLGGALSRLTWLEHERMDLPGDFERHLDLVALAQGVVGDVDRDVEVLRVVGEHSAPREIRRGSGCTNGAHLLWLTRPLAWARYPVEHHGPLDLIELDRRPLRRDRWHRREHHARQRRSEQRALEARQQPPARDASVVECDVVGEGGRSE
jgi:hypothetical protein